MDHPGLKKNSKASRHRVFQQKTDDRSPSLVRSIAHKCFQLKVSRSIGRQARFPVGTWDPTAPSGSHCQTRAQIWVEPRIWDPQYIESLTSTYGDECLGTRLEELKFEAKRLLEATVEPSSCLELVDSIQRLGVAYHFEDEIKNGLDGVYGVGAHSGDDLYTAALQFRLLRQRGYGVTPDIFSKFLEKERTFKPCTSLDAKGLLSLYEASHTMIHGEEVLEDAKEFSVKHLNYLMGNLQSNLREQVQHALEMPLHWRMPRLEAKHYIDVNGRSDERNMVLLELARLDFNFVQSKHQEELKEVSRKGLTKLISILTVIDDIYDVYGSLDELELFTEAIKRWDIEALETLPEYMKICYMALFNFVHEVSHDTLKDYGWNILPFIRKEWERLCMSYLVEAKWFGNDNKPVLDEYLRNGWISVGGPVAMVHAYFLQGQPIGKDSINFLDNGSELIYWSSVATRLNDDLGTSKAEMKRGDVPKAVECHMIQTGGSHEDAREYIKGLARDCWKKMNEECLKCSLPNSYVETVLNMVRTAQCIYQHGEGSLTRLSSLTFLTPMFASIFGAMCRSGARL
ncbi:trans-ocimene synthase [Cinnamomum micranthum f. kanehirae]|uniref:Trans-ocimene synthase n=1 Tax=Cinnamomum micranthum f. kanehirae TaxID=337451 RepID=A0A3S3NFB9_9MAGN|nr:trans-ocimene synthase [Cinnamomum micranthum f. kanehirae]